jgi:hypothetical protein
LENTIERCDPPAHGGSVIGHVKPGHFICASGKGIEMTEENPIPPVEPVTPPIASG